MSGQSCSTVADAVVTEHPTSKQAAAARWIVRLRVTWTLTSVLVVECLVFGLAVLPGALFWEMFSLLTYPFLLLRIVVLSMAFVPAYGLFAFSLMVLSAFSTAGWDGGLRQTRQCRSRHWSGRS